jgi:hypothetical protein
MTDYTQPVSADSGKAVERFDFTEDGMEHDFYGKYVRHEDYAKLEQQRAALVEALKEAAKTLELIGALHASDRAIAALKAAGVVLT